jgi:hypothetical protein
MIDREEILELAREFQLPANTVEKDYALGWLLAGISSHHALRDSWVFKGGTCRKKCFFETYRFSEDLDFTLRDPPHLDEAFLLHPGDFREQQRTYGSIDEAASIARTLNAPRQRKELPPLDTMLIYVRLGSVSFRPDPDQVTPWPNR